MAGPIRSAPVDIGDGFTVEFTFANGRLDASFAPELRRPRQHLLAGYRRARDAFLVLLAEEMGISIAVAEL